jgi:hypothetical protein
MITTHFNNQFFSFNKYNLLLLLLLFNVELFSFIDSLLIQEDYFK